MNLATELAPLIIGSALALGIVILVTCVGYGILGYDPEKAQAIRAAEASPDVVVEEIRRIRVRRPERFQHDRLDRHPHYLGLHVAAMGYAISVLASAPTTSNVSALSNGTKTFMAICFLTGSVLVFTGAAMGTRFGRWYFHRAVHDNIASPMLSDDIRLPYLFACTGMAAMAVSLAIYASTSFGSTWGSIGGWMTGVYAMVSAWLMFVLYKRIQTYNKARNTLIAEAVESITSHDDQ